MKSDRIKQRGPTAFKKARFSRSSCRQQVLVLIPLSLTARERRRDAERRRCSYGWAIIKLWEELDFTISAADDVRGG